MTVLDILEETYTSLSSNKVRSGLTMLGIVIGISSVIAMVSIGAGAQGSIQARIQSIGSNLVIVRPGAVRGPGVQVSAGRGSAKSLTLDDANALTALSSAKAIAPEATAQYQITAKGKNTRTEASGVTSAYAEVRNLEVDAGSFITDQEVQSLARVVVLGPVARDDLFGVDADAVGQNIRIKNIEFKVIGVLKAKGGNGFGNADDWTFVPVSTAQRYLTGDKYVSTINIEATDANSMTDLQQQVTDTLLTRHHISDPALADFSTLNQADIVATASSITSTFTILLAAVAGISLVVGGIGIMNMMLTTVTERTREIGLRKAIGAKNSDISIQFLTEAVLLTVIGGVIGVILGWSISFGMTYFNILATSVSFSSILLAFGVSALIGIVFGYYPARRAASLSPIDALRYE